MKYMYFWAESIAFIRFKKGSGTPNDNHFQLTLQSIYFSAFSFLRGRNKLPFGISVPILMYQEVVYPNSMGT
jgi:hypothetical protein